MFIFFLYYIKKIFFFQNVTPKCFTKTLQTEMDKTRVSTMTSFCLLFGSVV